MLPHQFHPLEFLHIRSKQDLPHLAFVGVLVIGIIVGVYLALQPQIFNKQAAEGNLVDLRFDPETLNVEYGKVYETKITINPKAQRVTAAELKIGYDPKAVSIIEVANEGFLPVTLKTQDHFDGNMDVVYASTIENQSTQQAALATLKFKVLATGNTDISVKPGSGIAVSSQEGNVLTQFPVLRLQFTQSESGAEESSNQEFPNNLLTEPVVLPESSPILREFQEILEPDPEMKPPRVDPELSLKYAGQLGQDIFIEPVIALNEVIEEKAREIISGDR